MTEHEGDAYVSPMVDPSLEKVRAAVEASIAAKRSYFDAHAAELVAAARAVAAAVRAGGKILIFGNGGSAADAQHIASEFVNRMARDREPIAAIALTTDSSALTSIANDHAFERVFSRQLEALARPGDVALGITTSGNSPNVMLAFEAAVARDLVTVGFLGRDGGKCRALCAHPLVVPVASTQRVQEVHILLGHLFAELVEDELVPESR